MQYILHAVQLHYSNDSGMLLGNLKWIMVRCRKQLWGVFHFVVLSVLRVVTVGHKTCGRLHMTEYVFPDESIALANMKGVARCSFICMLAQVMICTAIPSGCVK